MAKSRKSKQIAQQQARKNRRKQIRRKQWQHSLGVLLASTTSTLVCSDVFAQTPSGANVVAGSAVVANAGPTLNVNASTNRTIVNWDSFSVGANHTANFNLPSANAAILNRVTSANLPSNINGALNSNGHVYLVNPSGIVVGSQGMVNTNGFTASTFDVSNSEFMAGGKLTFRDQGGSGSIINYGSIQTGEGGAHLIANQIANHGSIASNGGNVTLSGGGTVTLENGTTYVQASMETLSNGISPTAGLIQNTGTIRATGAASIGGEVYLVNPNGNILHDGTIAAHNVNPDGKTTGGHVQLEAESIELNALSSIDASGTHGGGKVLVGGDWQGSGEMQQASSVVMEANSTIDASAIQSGDGGTIVLWTDLLNSNSVTRAFGTLLARGGALLGNGGQIETSGSTIETSGVHVDAGALHGVGGLWLIDPFNYVIDAIAANNIVSALNTGTSVTVSTAVDDASFGSSGNSGDNGDITVTADIVTGAMTGDATLTLQAARHIRIGGTTGIDATQNGNTAKLNVKLWADTDNSGDGINMITAAGIKTNGGSLTFGNGDTATIGGVNVQVGGDLYISGSVAQALETAGGDITIHGETIVANSAGGVTFDSAGGDIVFGGVLNSGNSYSAVNSSLDWNAALSAAKSGTGDQIGDTYLATITSRLENAIAGIAVNYQASWLGGRRVTGIGTDSAWRWVAGPEGLQDGGNGMIYAYQNASGGGTTAANGLFNNWNAGEPNNWNGTASDPLSTEMESAHQFTGNAGLWNDLPKTGTNLDWYVRETNLAPTAVTIDAGTTGTVTMGGVGGSKALASLDVTSAGVTVVNGSALVTTGAQNFSSALDVNSAIGLMVDGTTLTTGGTVDFTATGDITVDASLVAPGTVSIDGAHVVINGDIDTSGATGARVLVKGWGDVIVSNGVGITTDGGDVTLWSDSDNSGQGGIHVQPNVSIDTRTAADRIAGTHTTGGGSIVIAGGLDDAGVSSGIGNGTAGDGTPDGYAVNLTGTRAGVHFGNNNSVAHNTAINLFSGSGDILVNGKSTLIDGLFSFGVVAYQGYTFDGGQTGDITLNGNGSGAATAAGGFDMAAHRDDASGLSTIQTADGNIVLNGYSRNGTTENLAIAIDGAPTARVLIQATGSGNVTLRGDAVGTGPTAVRFGGLDLLAASGDIQVLGDNGGILSTVVVPGATLNLGSAAGTGVTSSTSDILLQSDDIQISTSTVADTTGTLTVEPTATSFTSSLTWPDANLSIASTLGGLTLGKEGNTADITISSAQTVGGPVNVYGGNININNAIDTSGGGADGDILLKGTGSISLAANGDLTTDGGNVILWGSSDGGNVDGYVNLADGSSISTNGGHVWLGGSTSKVTPGTLVGDGTTTWNGLTVGNGYAVSGTDVAMLNGGNWRVGIGLANANISTGGGDFYAAGMDLNTVGGGAGSGSGIVHGGTNGSINAGSGSIEMNAYSGTNGAYAVLIGVHPNGVDNSLTLSSSSNATTAVSLLAETASTNANFMGLLIEDDLKISATGTGGISLTGRSAADIGIRVGSPVDSGNLEALAASGTITIDTGDDDLAFYNAASQSYFGAKAGSPVTSSSSDIVIIADKIPSNSAGINIDTTGTLAFEPLSTSGTSANLTGWSMGTDLTGLRVGKSTNAFATVTLGNALDINGPIDVYGSAIHLYNDITSNGNQSYSGDITLHGDIAFDATTGDLAFGQSIDGTYAVEITAGNVDFGSDVGAVTALTSLVVNGSATLGGDVVTNGAQTWNDAVTVEANAVLRGLSLDFGSTIDGQTNDLELRTDALQLGGNVSSTGALIIAPNTTGTTVGVGTGSGSLSLSQAEFGLLQDGFSSITIGGSNAGELKVGGLTSLQDNLVLQAGSSSDLQVTDPISWSSDTALTLAAGQDIWVMNDIDVNGSGATLNLLYGGTNGSTAPAVGRNFYIDLANRRTIDFADTSANLKIGNETYTLIDSVADFTSMSSAGRYAFATGLDLSGTTYNNAVYTTTFTGKLDGLGHAADGMIINNSTGGNLGLFAQLNGSTIRHLGITNFNIKTNSTSSSTEYRIGGLAGNVGGAGTPVSSVTNIDGVWSSGVISTEQGGTQKFFFGGGLVGSQNGGFMNLSRSYSTANVSTDGSYTSNLATGGLVGDIGINTNLPTSYTNNRRHCRF
ncbi:MAG: filamentous hemagglutinin N-terminal domain-containing protein [Pirellulaceae bacterium]